MRCLLLSYEVVKIMTSLIDQKRCIGADACVVALIMQMRVSRRRTLLVNNAALIFHGLHVAASAVCLRMPCFASTSSHGSMLSAHLRNEDASSVAHTLGRPELILEQSNASSTAPQCLDMHGRGMVQKAACRVTA